MDALTENFKTVGRRAFSVTVTVITILSFLQFLVYYVCMGYLYENEIAILIAPHLIDFLEALFPVLAALIVFLRKEPSIKNKIIPTILISLSRLAYVIPYYYIYYVSDVFNSIEAITLAFLVSIVYLSFFFLQTFICIYILNRICFSRTAQNSNKAKASYFSLDDRFNFGIFSTVLLIFVIFFARELIDTISYFIDVKGDFLGNEILTIAISYILLPIFSAIHYVILIFIKNKILCRITNEEK